MAYSSFFMFVIKRKNEFKNIVLVYNIVFTVNGHLVLFALFIDIWGKIISDAYFEQQERRQNEPIL